MNIRYLPILLLCFSQASFASQSVEQLYSKLVRINLCSSHWGAIGMIDLTSTRLSIMKEMRKQIDDVEFAALVSNVIHDVDVLRERSPYIESDDESERVKNRTSLVRNCQELVQEFK